MINIYSVLSDYGITKEQVIEKDQNWFDAFSTHDHIVEVHNRNKSERTEELVDRSATSIIKDLKKNYPELFEEKDKALSEPAPAPVETEVSDSFQAEKERMRSLIANGNHNAIQEWFDEQPIAKQGRMIEHNNFQITDLALRTKNPIIIYFFLDRAQQSGVYDQLVRAKAGDIFTKIVSTQDPEFVSDAINSLKKNKAEARELVKNGVAMQIAIEGNQMDIIDMMERFYDEIGAEKLVGKVTEMMGDMRSTKSVIDVIEAGKMDVGQHTVFIKRKPVLQFRIAGSVSKTAKNYLIIHKVEDAAYFQREKSIYKAGGFEIREVEFIHQERTLGMSRYELMKAWINFCGLPSLEHNIALMGIARIAETMNLMLDGENADLKKSYLDKLRYVIENPRSLTIGNYYVEVRDAYLEDFSQAGFLTEAGLPTMLFYAVLYMHQFKFPFNSHPFECVNVPVEYQFLYDVYSGKHGTHKFISDGEMMYEDITFTPKRPVKETLLQTSREVVTNLESPATSKIKIAEAINDGFIPLFFTVAASDAEMPPLQVSSLGYKQRIINYGIYNFISTINKTNIWINSYPIHSFMKGGASVQTYKGHLSNYLLSSADGVILSDKTGGKLLLRAMNYISVTAENWKSPLSKKTMEQDFFGSLFKNTDGLMGLLFSTMEVRSKSLFPPVIPRNAATAPAPIVPAKAERKPILKHKVVRVARRDDRVYLKEAEAKSTLPSPLFSVYRRVKDLLAEDRDEAILKELLISRIDAISPMNLVYLGFDLKRWAVKPTLVVLKGEKTMAHYEMRMPSYITGLYYIKRVA